ncbi:YebC/PmpR family DNA-binding transcriptional regulator [Corallococcus sp. H22C18031201]|uniref:YebC/PmpR family DNA-binding transcriptional regulator n=1 Tax=Citreicoccus inhibens TaxID=2849499 RepID=UPI000E76D4DA|nr:YebC/PmpR family DNA-binding transcriptional regulator [Citreicoccus inhibens]MBU8897570.1 YebC/PmpR family DNA-binding transcriptional regulator [Citreicoccus inhibens]RJS19254.1 YebC/PmpR family DNA-binding transcriptional regulator [Corallococcus sp. H22C18031201]
MSGHNRWSKIKRQKAAMGATKGALYSKVIKEITVSARLGGGDPAGNARLRVAIAAAREANMPRDSIERAVKKGTGELEGESYEEVTYEGYGPGGVALIVECLTDNRNRTASDVRSILGKWGGNLATEGAVGWMFHKKGVITVKPGPSEDAVMEKALEAGAEDVLEQGADGFEVRTAPTDLHTVAASLEAAGMSLGEQKWTYVPQNTLKVDGDNARKVLRLMDALEDNDDVQNVHANFEIDESLMESLSP